jgi:hypothetical protein
MFISYFESLTNSTGKRVDIDFKTYFSIHKKVKDKNSAPLFSFAEFENNIRRKENILSISGCVIDFDNANYTNILPEDVIKEIDGIEYLYYSTISHTKALPKWRLIIPFSRAVLASEYKLICDDIMHMLGNPDGVDYSTFEPARCFYIPSIADDNSERFFNYEKGSLYTPDIYLGVEKPNDAAMQPQSKDTSSRNAFLKAVVAKCAASNMRFDAVVRRVHYIDKMQHARPLFQDKTEKIKGKTDELRAIYFTANIYDSFSETPTNILIDKKEPKINNNLISAQDLNDCPGLVGLVARDIYKQMMFKQAPLALASAINIVGTLKSHSVATQTDLRTNFYCIGVCNTGCGKQFGYDYAQALFQNLGIFKCVSSEPRSHNGIATALTMGESASLCLWDEIGQDFKTMLSDNQTHFLAKISTELLKLFSQAKGVYQTGFLSDLEKNQQKLFYQPSLNILGMTVPEPFYASLNSGRIYDGLLPRILLFKTAFDKLERESKRESIRISNAVLTQCQDLATGMFCNREDATFNKPKNCFGFPATPKIVPYSKEFDALLTNLEEETMAYRLGADRVSAAIYTRACEHIQKLALVISDNTVLSEQDFNYAERIFKKCSAEYVDDLKLYVRSEDDRFGVVGKASRLLRLIPEQGAIQHKDLLRLAKIPAVDLRKLLRELVESEEIEVQTKKGATKPSLFYSRAKR